MAQDIYVRQFDHPYDYLYWKVLNELPDAKKKDFFSLGVRYKGIFRMFMTSLLLELAEFGDYNVCKYIEQWTELPQKNESMPQEALGVFIASYMILGKFDHIFIQEEFRAIDPEDAAILACGRIFYWLNRINISDDKKKEGFESAWNVLLKHELGLSLWAIQRCEDVRFIFCSQYFEKYKYSLVQAFPEEITEICRQALKNPSIQKKRSIWREDGVLGYGIEILGMHGKLTDIAVLNQFIDHSNLGQKAIASIQNLKKIFT